MKKKFIPGYQPEGLEVPIEDRVPPTGGSGTAPAGLNKEPEVDIDLSVASTIGDRVGPESRELKLSKMKPSIPLTPTNSEIMTNKVPGWEAPLAGFTTLESIDMSSVVTKGDRLIIETLIAGLEFQLQAGNAPSVYKNKLSKEIKRIKDELGK